MWLTDVSIRRPVFIVMFVLALIILGLTARGKMPAELYPDVEFPFVSVIATYPGAGPQEMETLIAEPIERAVSSIGNIKNVISTSQDGIAVIGIQFELGTNLDAAAADVRDKVSGVGQELPRDLEQPTISKVDVSGEPVLTIGLTGPISNKQMRILADDVIRDRLSKVGGVAGVYVSGGDVREVLVSVDKDRLDAYGASINDVVTAMQTENLNVPSGSIKEGQREYAVRTVGEFQSATEIQDLRINISGSSGTQVVRMRDIATVTDTIAEPTALTRLNGKDTVVLAIQKQSDANTVDVADGVKSELRLLGNALPTGVKPIIATDQSEMVKDSLHDVNESLTVGILLVVLIVFLFLHTARATFIVAIAIPTSILSTFLPMSAFGFGMNMMTMLALSLSVGILVDDSIVILENIERHLRKGEPPREAALNGRSEIGLAAITITMVDVVVFVPIAFMGGIVGQFFRQFGITIATATLFSLFMSFTLTPMLASRWMSREQVEGESEEEEERRVSSDGRLVQRVVGRTNVLVAGIFRRMNNFYSGLDRRYRGLLVWALDNRFLTVVIGFVSLLVVFALSMPPVTGNPVPRMVIAGIALGLALIALAISRAKMVAVIFGLIMIYLALVVQFPFGFEMFPTVDEGTFSVKIEGPAGSSLRATDSVAKQVEQVLARVPEMEYYLTTVGSSSAAGAIGAGDVGSQYGRVSVKLVDKLERERSVEDVIQAVTQDVALIPGAEIRVGIDSGMGGGGQPIAMEVTGSDMTELAAVARRVENATRNVKGTVDVNSSWKIGKPEAQVTVDRVRAAEMDITVASIAQALRTSIEGNTDAKLRDGGTEYDIRVRLDEVDRSNVMDVSSIIVGHRDGAPVYLRDVAQVELAPAPVKIDRKNRQRLITISADLARGYALGGVQNEINRVTQPLATGSTQIVTGGVGEIMVESFGYMISALILAIALVYMLMAALFESLVSPLIIMFALPQAMVGALLALITTGHRLSIVSMIGIIMLTGLVTKNAILLVDYTNTLRGRGKGVRDAILEAGPTRLRPIIMTTLAMVFGMLPTALAISRGAEIRAPMAIAVIGGLIVSTLLTLIVIPVLYTLIDQWTQGFRRRLGYIPVQLAQESEETVAQEVPTESGV